MIIKWINIQQHEQNAIEEQNDEEDIWDLNLNNYLLNLGIKNYNLWNEKFEILIIKIKELIWFYEINEIMAFILNEFKELMEKFLLVNGFAMNDKKMVKLLNVLQLKN